VGLGGDFAQAPLLAKKALLRTIGARHPDPLYAEYELELLAAINALGLGPQALGGLATALEVFIEVAPCHIASLPVAVCLNCHATRHTSATL
jgi:fumarate hydratase subunit alpha